MRQEVRHSPRSRHLGRSLGAPAGKGGLRALFPQATCGALASRRARKGYGSPSAPGGEKAAPLPYAGRASRSAPDHRWPTVGHRRPGALPRGWRGVPTPDYLNVAWQLGRGGAAVWRRRRTSRHTDTQPIAAQTGVPLRPVRARAAARGPVPAPARPAPSPNARRAHHRAPGRGPLLATRRIPCAVSALCRRPRRGAPAGAAPCRAGLDTRLTPPGRQRNMLRPSGPTSGLTAVEDALPTQ